MPQMLAAWLKSCTDVSSILDRTLDRCLALTGTRRGNIQVMDWTSGHLEIAAQHGFDHEFLKFFARVRADDGSACGRALAAREAIIVNDVERDKAFSPASRSIVLGSGIRAVQSMPLISTSGALVGMLSVHFGAVRYPAVSELMIMKTLAQTAANAVIAQRARVAEPVRRSLDLIASSKALLRQIARDEEMRTGGAVTTSD